MDCFIVVFVLVDQLYFKIEQNIGGDNVRQ